AVDGTLDAAGRGQLQEELDRAAGSFGLRHAVIVSPDGRIVAGSTTALVDPEQVRGNVARALGGRVRLASAVRRERDGSVLLELAIPVRGAFDHDRTPVLLAALDARQALLPLLGMQVTSGLT